MRKLKTPLVFMLIIMALTSYKNRQETTVYSSIEQNKYFIKFKINGIQKSYSAAAASFFDMQGKFGFQVASAKAASDTTAINVMVVASSPITANTTYENQSHPTTYAPIIMTTVSFIISGLSFNSAMQSFEPGFKSAEISVAELTPTSVKGTFSGVLLRDATDASTVVFEITEGEFFAPRK